MALPMPRLPPVTNTRWPWPGPAFALATMRTPLVSRILICIRSRSFAIGANARPWACCRRSGQGRVQELQHGRSLRQQLPRDDQTLYLIGAFVDLGDLGVPIEALDLDASDISHAAVNLHGVRNVAHGGIASEA